MISIRNARRFFYKACKQPGYALNVLGKRTRSYLYYQFGKGKASQPEAITLFLTHRCNLRCTMCGQWGESGVTKKKSPQDIKEELSFGELSKLVDGVYRFKPNITLFGGEPLLHPDCIEIIRYIKKKGMHCLMITNGSLLSDLAKDVVESGLDELNVSLDGGRELHDQIRGMPGLFNKIMNGIKEINRFKRKSGRKKPLINLQCTITRYNYMNLEQMLSVAKEAEACSLTFHNLIFLGRELIEKQKEYDRLLDCSSYDWEGFVFSPGIDHDLLYAKIKEVLSCAKNVSVDFYPNFSLEGLKEYYQNPSFLPKEYKARCLSPWMVAYIFPDGSVHPCLNFTYAYGNIKNNRFKDIWNGPSAIRYRRILKEKSIFPVCVRCTELYRY